jgi:thiol-disulfide isomerase/thioredoxin
MLLELSLRPLIALLLICGLMIGGCGTKSPAPGQANESADVSAPAPAPVNETVVEEVIGTLDRSHRGEAAPETAFEDPTGARVTLASFAGKPVLLNLWATWCGPCVKEMPTLDALSVTLGESVQVLVVSQDFDGAAKVDPFFQKAAFKRLQPYLDTRAGLSTGLGANLPTTILYDSQGREVWRMLGSMDWTGETAKELIAEAG